MELNLNRGEVYWANLAPTLDRPGVAVCDQIRAVDKTRLVRHIGSLDRSEMAKIDDALRQILLLS